MIKSRTLTWQRSAASSRLRYRDVIDFRAAHRDTGKGRACGGGSTSPACTHDTTMSDFIRAARASDRGGGPGVGTFTDRAGWDAVQKLISLRPPGSPGTRHATNPHIFRMNLAALVVPGIITGVCVLVGLMTLHEYCLGEPDDARDGSDKTVPRCFLTTDDAARSLYAAKFGESQEQQTTLSYAKFAAVSFYGASLLTTLATLPHNNGPLKLSLILYHTLICLWSTVYYTLDFFHLIPQVRSERDGMLEYSAMRVIAVWPVTSTLMISKVAILCIMTRHVGEVRSPRVSLLGFEDHTVKIRGESVRGGLPNTGESDGPKVVPHARQSAVDAEVENADRGANGWLNTFDHIVSKFTGRAEMSARLSRELMEEGGLMSASWDVWKASLVNNLMLLAGAFGLISNMYWVRVLSIAVSCLLFIALMHSFRTLFQFVVRRVQHPQDRRSMQVLETLTYVTWTLFPIIQIARDAGYINTATQFLMMTAADIVAKMMYSINLIFSNFWLMNNADGLMRLDEALFTDALELSRYSQLAATTLEKAKREAESVSALHRAFVANISHELRTPLNSIIAFNSLLLEDDTLTEPQREFVSSAIVSAEALLGIIGQILDFAKLESTSGMHQELVIESFDINEMVNELVDIVGHQANKNQVELVLDIAPELDGLNVRGDKFRLRQALINVVNNSIKFTREGGEVRLRVTVLPDHDPVTRRISRTSYEDIARGVGRGKSWTMGLALDQHHEEVDEGTNHGAEKEVMENDFLAPHAPRVVVAFEVCDNGIGIARDKLKLIFMPFGQASVSSTREYGGTGLGLAITNNIVHSMGGTITCSSELDKGTTMVLSVPLEVRNRVDAARLRQLDPETRVLSVIAKHSLANAIGHAATCAGAATHVYIEAGARFPHTEHQRKLWSAEVATAIFRAQSRSEGCAVLVMEECFLAPLWTEWCRMFRDAPSMPNMPPIVLIVGKKMQIKDMLSKEKKLRQNSRGSGGLRQNSFGGFSGIGDSETDLGTLERREEGWRALISSVVQLIRPVKPTLLRDALKSAEVMLHQEQARTAAKNLGQPPSPTPLTRIPAAVAAAPEAGHASRRNAPARNPTATAAVPGRRDALVSPCRVTRSASKRLATSRHDDGAEEPAGEAPVNSGLRRRSSVRLRAGDDGGARAIDPLVPRLPERGWIQPRGASAAAPVRVAAAAAAAARPAASQQSGGSISSFVTAADELVFRHGGHVLIVEDNPMNQKVAKVVVKHCGMTADVANNGAEAVEIMKGGGLYDVILMDIQMPVMDGLEATQRIREMEAAGTIANGNYIVATSANATAENHREGYEAGMDEYITKPIYPSKLKELLAKPKRMQTVLELDDGADGDAEVTSLIGRNGSG